MPSWFPSAHLPHCAASRQKQGASIRIALRSLLFEKVHKPDKWIKPDYLRPVSNKVGKGVDVIEIKLAVTIIDDVLDAANFNLRLLHYAFDLLNDFVRRRVALNLQACFRSIDRACRACKILAARGLADVRRAEVKRLASEMNFDSVEKLAANNFHTHDMTAACGNKFLHQGC